MTFKDFGIRTDNLKISILPYTFLVLIGSLVIYKFFLTSPEFPSFLVAWKMLYVFPLSFIFLSVLQEVIFRGGYMYLLKKWFKNVFVVVSLNTAPFVLMHVFLSLPASINLFSVLAGLSFALVYYYYPNLILAAISHVLINSLVIPFCHFNTC